MLSISDHTRQDSMEAWSKNGDFSPMPPPLERRKYRNRSKAHSIVGTPNYIGMSIRFQFSAFKIHKKGNFKLFKIR